jgi:hypothetical protein
MEPAGESAPTTQPKPPWWKRWSKSNWLLAARYAVMGGGVLVLPTTQPKPPWWRRWSKSDWHLAARYAVMLVGLGVFVWVLVLSVTVYGTYRQVESRELALEDLAYNDLTKLAIDVKRDQSKSLFTYNVVLLGVLWGLILLKKEGPLINWGDVPEGVLFLLGNVAVALNALCYSLYAGLVSSIASVAARRAEPGALSVPNFLDPRIDVFFRVQEQSLIAILILVGLVVFSAHKLKES